MEIFCSMYEQMMPFILIVLFLVGCVLGSALYTAILFFWDKWDARQYRKRYERRNAERQAALDKSRWAAFMKDLDAMTAESLWGFEFGCQPWPRNRTPYSTTSYVLSAASGTAIASSIMMPPKVQGMILGDLYGSR